MQVHDDLIGKTFGLWKVIDIYDDYIQPKTGWHKKRYLCQCSCEMKTIRPVLYSHLKNGSSTNCGCQRKNTITHMNIQIKKKYNIYDLSGDYGIGYTAKGEEFYFDKEDYEKIKNYFWNKNKQGYIVTNVNNKEIALHILVMNRINKGSDKQEIDHIHGKSSRNDSRKENLRICTRSNNGMNRGLQSNNKSKYSGIYYDKNIGKYKVNITVNKNQMYLGVFNNIDEAIKVRKEAENKYFGEYSYEVSQKM